MTNNNADVNTNFRSMVRALAKPGRELIKNWDASDAHLIHMIVGLMGETLELQMLDSEENLLEELGDIEFYFEGIKVLLYPINNNYDLSKNEAVNLAHDQIGFYITKEVEDLCNLIKKITIYKKPYGLDMKDKIIDAITQLDQKLANVYYSVGLTRQYVLCSNMEKLMTGNNARYAAGTYSDEQANARADKNG